MKLGLLTDIHEHVEYLQLALDRFQAERVDQVVVIGDVFHMGERVDETCRLLASCNAIGVWGNHDYGLCVDPDEEARSKYSEGVITFMTSLRPRLEINGCHFAHIEPWLNPEDIADLWYFDGAPDKHERLDRIFNAVPTRLMFAGHYHQWLLVSPHGIEDWTGDRLINLSSERYFVVIAALCEGHFAVLNTDTGELHPFSVSQVTKSPTPRSGVE